MTYGIDSPIKIWASGKYYDLITKAIELYNDNIYENINIQVINLTFDEILFRLDNYTSISQLPNLILVEDT